jgi:hypothetical protein
MPNYIGHINKWKERANIDFFTEFVKAWIPFNAWMSINYVNLETDRAIINEIKRDSSIKTKIKYFLKNDEQECMDFKNYLSRFHRILEELELKNNRNCVNFTNVVIERNKEEKYEFFIRGLQYKALYDKSQKKFVAVIINSKKNEIFNSIKDEYDYDEFCKYIEKKELSDVQKGYIKSAYQAINPFIPKNLIATDENSCINIGSYKFCDDIDLISKAIIENLYSLRCMLFHGDIEPKEDTNELFASAYFILKYILKALD